jgi:hypothetical protein
VARFREGSSGGFTRMFALFVWQRRRRSSGTGARKSAEAPEFPKSAQALVYAFAPNNDRAKGGKRCCHLF